MYDKIKSFKNLSNPFNKNFIPPNEISISNAIHILKLCEKYKFDIECITPSNKSIVFQKQFKKFCLLFKIYNDGSIIILFDRKGYDTISKAIHINDIPNIIQSLKL